jgi:hypothetical protein
MHSRPPWTIAHSFCALMCGFEVAPGQRTLVFSPDVVRRLKERDATLLPELSKHGLRHRENGDNLLEVLVWIQASWFSFQCLARWYAQHTVSLIELITGLHCLCMFVTSVFLWKKPINIGGLRSVRTPSDIFRRQPRPQIWNDNSNSSAGPTQPSGVAWGTIAIYSVAMTLHPWETGLRTPAWLWL